MTETEKATNGADKAQDGNAKNLASNILKQVEYYFGDFNLPKDKFLQEQIKEDDGWVTMETMLNFKRLSSMSSEADVILGALKDSELIQVDLEKKKIRYVVK